MDLKVVFIDDDIAKIKDDALTWELVDRYGDDNIEFFSDPTDGINFIKQNLDINLIVFLDIQFPANPIDGHTVLSQIRENSKLIPVILWSGVNEDKETFSDLINNNAFAFIPKSATVAEALPVIQRVEDYYKTNLDNTIEDWIIGKDEDKDKPVYFSADGKAYSLNDILHEIRTQTEVGKSFAKRLNELTIDLLLRKKENLNG